MMGTLNPQPFSNLEMSISLLEDLVERSRTFIKEVSGRVVCTVSLGCSRICSPPVAIFPGSKDQNKTKQNIRKDLNGLHW